MDNQENLNLKTVKESATGSSGNVCSCDYLKTNDFTISEVVGQLDGITSNSTLVNKVLDYLQEHDELLGAGDDVKIRKILPKLKSGQLGLIVMKSRYSINIKKSLFILIAFLLDLKFFNGFASLLLTLTGFPTQALTKIKDEERCLILDVLLGAKQSANDFDYNNRACVNVNVDCCSFRNGNMCTRAIQKIDEQLERLTHAGVIEHKNGIYKQTF